MAKTYVDKAKAINAVRHVCYLCKVHCRMPFNCEDCRIEESLVALKDLPAADVEEVIRCEKCRYSRLTCDKNTLACIKQSAYKKPDDYCSKGKRKDT